MVQPAVDASFTGSPLWQGYAMVIPLSSGAGAAREGVGYLPVD
ncbi:hypothetical protein JCM16814_32540 [Desulfobaculum senezii]